jgi:hypothetical protein
VQRVLDGFRRSADEVEQPSDFGDGQREHAPGASSRRGHIRYC